MGVFEEKYQYWCCLLLTWLQAKPSACPVVLQLVKDDLLFSPSCSLVYVFSLQYYTNTNFTHYHVGNCQYCINNINHRSCPAMFT